MAFRGWPVDAIEFFEGLEADNTKAYWTSNKSTYEDKVRAPMVELLAEMAPEFGEGRIFRPFRDVRFSKDKSPYKTSIAASLAGGGYLQLTANGLGAGRGMYQMMPDQTERYRQAVDDDGSGIELERLIATVEKRGIEVSGHDSLKSAPRGYPKDHPRIELLRCKGLICWQQWPVGAWLGTVEAKKRVSAFLRHAQPISDWLDTNVGVTTMSDDARR
ncbi:MAG: DUF2461 domain-containing protein [Acidimicrobiales bacterium]